MNNSLSLQWDELFEWNNPRQSETLSSSPSLPDSLPLSLSLSRSLSLARALPLSRSLARSLALSISISISSCLPHSVSLSPPMTLCSGSKAGPLKSTSMIKWIRTSRLQIKIFLSLGSGTSCSSGTSRASPRCSSSPSWTRC